MVVAARFRTKMAKETTKQTAECSMHQEVYLGARNRTMQFERTLKVYDHTQLARSNLDVAVISFFYTTHFCNISLLGRISATRPDRDYYLLII